MAETKNDTIIDPAIIDRLGGGDEKAFNAIYDHYVERLYYFALRFVESEEAKDIVSEAFILLWDKRADFDHSKRLQHYLFLLVRNKCFNYLKRELMKLNKQAEVLRQFEMTDEEDLDLEHLKTELVSRIYQEAEALPTRIRQVFLLSFAEGLSPTAIAEKLGLSIQTVKNQKLTAVRLLKAALGERALLLSMLILLCSEN